MLDFYPSFKNDYITIIIEVKEVSKVDVRQHL